MALIKNITTTPATVGPLAKSMVFTAKRGTIAISSDGGSGDDYYPLNEGMSFAVPINESVTYWQMAAGYDGQCTLHYMPG